MSGTTTAEEKYADIRVNLFTAKEGQDPSKTKAFVSVRVKTEEFGLMLLNGIKVIDGSKGLFVAMPNQKRSIDGEDQYFDHYHPLTADGREAIGAKVLEAYEKKLGEQAGT